MAGKAAQIDMDELEALVANMLRSAIESLSEPKCRSLAREEEICETCASKQPFSASSSDNYAERSDAYAHGSASHGSASSHGSANSWKSASHGSASNQGSWNSHNSHKQKTADGNVRQATLNADLNNHDSYNAHGNYNNNNHDSYNAHGNYNNNHNSQNQWNSHGNYQYNNDQYYAPQ